MNNEIKSYILKLHNLATRDISQCKLITQRGSHPENSNVIWNVTFIFNDEAIKVEGEYFLSSAIDKIREVIEPQGYRILVKCADIDACHSGMQADMSSGTLIYKLTLLDNISSSATSKQNKKEVQFHVLADSEEDSVGTLQQQKEFRKTYYANRRSKR